MGVVGVTRLNDGVPAIPTFHVPLCETAGTPRMPTLHAPACVTPGVLLTFTLGTPLIMTLPETGNGDGARTGTGLASVLTTVAGADGGDCGSAFAANGASAAHSDTKPSDQPLANKTFILLLPVDRADFAYLLLVTLATGSDSAARRVRLRGTERRSNTCRSRPTAARSCVETTATASPAAGHR